MTRALMIFFCAIGLVGEAIAAESAIQREKDGKNFALKIQGQKRKGLKNVASLAEDLVQIFDEGGVSAMVAGSTVRYAGRRLSGNSGIEGENRAFGARFQLSVGEDRKSVTSKKKGTQEILSVEFSGEAATELMEAMQKAGDQVGQEAVAASASGAKKPDPANPLYSSVSSKARSLYAECAAFAGPNAVATCRISAVPLSKLAR
jgi:hypothetical protein